MPRINNWYRFHFRFMITAILLKGRNANCIFAIKVLNNFFSYLISQFLYLGTILLTNKKYEILEEYSRPYFSLFCPSFGWQQGDSPILRVLNLFKRIYRFCWNSIRELRKPFKAFKKSLIAL